MSASTAGASNDQRYFVADSRLAQAMLELPKPMPWKAGTALLMREIAGRYALPLTEDECRSTSMMVTA